MDTKTAENSNIRKQLVIFSSIVIIISVFIYYLMFTSETISPFVYLAMMWAPGLAALITSLIFRSGIKNFGWKPGKIKFLLYAYSLPLLISIAAYGIAWISGLTEFTPSNAENYKWAKMLGFNLPVNFIIGVLAKMILGFLFTIIFVLGEEIGWTGFLTPLLLKIYSPFRVSLIIGLFWAAWHYPAIIGGLYGPKTPLWIQIPGFTLVITGYSFIRTALVQKSKSLWTGTVLHASGNTILMGIFWEATVQKGYAAYFVSEAGIITGIVSISVAFAFFLYQNKKEINQ